MKKDSNFTVSQLRILFRFLAENERAQALNLRSHNPVDVKLVIEAQTCVDSIFSITRDVFFRASDSVDMAALKATRSELAVYVKDVLVSRWFLGGVDEHTLSCFYGYLDQTYLAKRFAGFASYRWLQFVVLCVFLLFRRWKHVGTSGFLEVVNCVHVLLRQIRTAGDGREKQSGARRGAVQAPAVLLLTHSHHRIVDYAVESITSSLVGKGIAPVLLFRDGFEPCRDRATNSSWQWCDGFPFVALGQESGALCTMLRFAFSRQGLQLIPRILFVYRRVLRSRSTDWRVKLLLLRKLPLLIVRLHRAFTYARDLIAQVAPVGILNCDNGSEDLYVKAFAYQSAQENIPFYRYKPVPSFPVPQPAFSSIASHMLATSEDEVIYRQGEAACEFWYVGSPLMDGAASYVSGIKRGSIGARIARDRLNVLYFTKRDFPNVDVVTAIAGYCQKRDTLAEIIVKMHPSDDDGSTTYGYLASEVPDFGNSIMITYYAKQDVGRVDELLSQADIVVTGSSNVIWSAFAQFKSVIYLAFRGMSSEGHILGYSKYATSDFVAISLLSELSDAIRSIIDKIDHGQTSTHYEHYDALMRSFFCDGEFNSSERICRVLTKRADL